MVRLKMKVSGHIIERGVLTELYELVKGSDCDLTEVELYLPTLKGGWEKQCPSAMKFNLISLKDTYGPCHKKILAVFLKQECYLLDIEEEGGNA